MNVAQVLRERADRSPEALALIDGRGGACRRFTYRELDERAARTAALLTRSGLAAGETVLVLHPMSAELYVALAAILRCGLAAMFVDPSAGREGIERSLRLHPPQALIAGSKLHLLRLVFAGLRRIPRKFSIGLRVPGATPLEHARRLPPDRGIHPCAADAPALVSFTSGSTGGPKAVLRTHGFLLAQHRAVEQCLELTPGESELSTLPIFVLANLASGVTSLIPDADLRRPDAVAAAPVVRQILEHRPQRIAASPAFYERILDHCEPRGLRLPGLRRVFAGGAPISIRLMDRLRRAAPQADVTAVYGSSEAEPIAAVSLREIDTADREAMRDGRGLLAGLPVPSIGLRILKDRWGTPTPACSPAEFERLCQPAGQAGEIVVSGGHVLPGYAFGSGDDEHKVAVDGVRWHRTGDAGLLDPRGRLWLLGRCAARIDDGRGAAYPLGAEHAALHHEAVRRAAVVSHRGRRILAVELCGTSLPPDWSDLLCSPAFAGVEDVRVLKRLPVERRHNAKIDYAALRSLLERSR